MTKLDSNEIADFRTEFLNTARLRNTQNAVVENGIKNSIINQSDVEKYNFSRRHTSLIR